MSRAANGLPVYSATFGGEQAERLLWRACFGPRKGEARALSRMGLDDAVRSLTHPGPEKLVGRPPRTDKGRRLDHVWLSPDLAPALTEIAIDRRARGWKRPSDHAPVTVALDL